jgi:hypothetical protein
LAKSEAENEAKLQAVTKVKVNEPVREKEKVKTPTDGKPVITHRSVRLDGKALPYHNNWLDADQGCYR